MVFARNDGAPRVRGWEGTLDPESCEVSFVSSEACGLLIPGFPTKLLISLGFSQFGA
jgi:hypothetical protein